MALAACGEDAEDVPIAAPEPTKPQYVANADAICRAAESAIREEASEQIDGLGRRQSLDGPEVARIAEQVVIPRADSELAQLRDLPRPDEDRETLERFFAAAEEGLDELRQQPELLESAERIFADAARLAREYGFQDCRGVAA